MEKETTSIDRGEELPEKEDRETGDKNGASATAKPPAEPATGIVQDLQDKLRKKEEESAEARDQLLRLRAETENFKKRLMKEKSDFALFANEKIIREMIGIYQNLERALAAPDTSVKSLKEGVEMILKQFAALMEKEKVSPIPALGQKFDPSKHEALAQIESDRHEENTVLEEYTRGYLLHDRVLLPSRVAISKKPAGAAEAPGDKKNANGPAGNGEKTEPKDQKK